MIAGLQTLRNHAVNVEVGHSVRLTKQRGHGIVPLVIRQQEQHVGFVVGGAQTSAADHREGDHRS